MWLDLDDLAPATDYIVTKRDQAVKLRMSQKGPGSEKPLTVPSMFYQTVQRVPNHPAIGKNIWLAKLGIKLFNFHRQKDVGLQRKKSTL